MFAMINHTIVLFLTAGIQRQPRAASYLLHPYHLLYSATYPRLNMFFKQSCHISLHNFLRVMIRLDAVKIMLKKVITTL
jgi:hypothetical protein